MGINDGILLVVIIFFGLLLYSVYREEQRCLDRREQSLPHPGERRKDGRRKQSFAAFLAWAARSLWSKHSK